MRNYLRAYVSILYRILYISVLAKQHNIAELVTSVEARVEKIAPRNPADIAFFLSHGSLWKLHPGFRKNMCLYYTMICLAHELHSGMEPQVNVCISMDNTRSTDGHCWLTLNDRVIHPTPLHDHRGYGKILSKNGRIQYWLRNARMEQNKRDRS